MKNFKFTSKNVLLALFFYGVMLFASNSLVIIFEEILYITHVLIEGHVPECTYVVFLISLIVKTILEQRKDYRADPKNFKALTIHYFFLNIIAYLVFSFVLFLLLRNGPFFIYTRYYTEYIIYDLVFLPLVKSPLLAFALDFLIATTVIAVANYLTYTWITRKNQIISFLRKQEQ